MGCEIPILNIHRFIRNANSNVSVINFEGLYEILRGRFLKLFTAINFLTVLFVPGHKRDNNAKDTS